MGVKARLRRLEVCLARGTSDVVPLPADDVFARIDAWTAFLMGEGPLPLAGPLPAGFDPAKWSQRDPIAIYLTRYDAVIAKAVAVTAGEHEQEEQE